MTNIEKIPAGASGIVRPSGQIDTRVYRLPAGRTNARDY